MIIQRQGSYCQLMFFLFVLTGFFAAPGCRAGDTSASPPGPDTAAPLVLEKKNGPLTLTLEIPKTTISVAEDIRVSLTVRAPEEYEITFPEFDAAFGDFRLEKTDTPGRTLTDTGVRSGRDWQASPYLPGGYLTPEITVTARRAAPDDSQPLIVTFPPLNITVTSFLGPDETDPRITDIYPPARPPSSRLPLLAGIAVLLLLAGLGLFFFRRRKANNVGPPPVPPHLAALAALDRLQTGMTDAGPARFYSELSLILRRYIEDAHGLRAPEQTTQEFLESLGRTSCFSGSQKDTLSRFLNRCDLIKFARLRPDRTEIMDTMALCRNFIEETAPRPAGEDQRSGRAHP